MNLDISHHLAWFTSFAWLEQCAIGSLAPKLASLVASLKQPMLGLFELLDMRKLYSARPLAKLALLVGTMHGLRDLRRLRVARFARTDRA